MRRAQSDGFPSNEMRAASCGLVVNLSGLDEQEAARRLSADGRNSLPTHPSPPLAWRVARQLTEPLTFVLVVVAVITLAALREVPEGSAIGAIVLLNVAIGVTQERRAESAIGELEQMTAPTARVRRSGRSSPSPPLR